MALDLPQNANFASLPTTLKTFRNPVPAIIESVYNMTSDRDGQTRCFMVVRPLLSDEPKKVRIPADRYEKFRAMRDTDVQLFVGIFHYRKREDGSSLPPVWWVVDAL